MGNTCKSMADSCQCMHWVLVAVCRIFDLHCIMRGVALWHTDSPIVAFGLWTTGLSNCSMCA